MITAPGHDRERSLGWLAVEWLEHFAIHGPGDVAGDSVAPIIDEYCAFLIDTYALDEDGRRLYDHVLLSRPKGCAKSEVAALIVLFEALGPCRFDGWAQGGEVYEDEWGLGFRHVYAPGEPLGKRLKNPFIRTVATEADQAGLVYDTVYLNLTEGPLKGAMPNRDSAGLGRIVIPGGGEIVPSTSSAASKDGGKDTLVIFDEALALDTILPTPNGFTTMGAVDVGDQLLGSDGCPVTVVKTSEVMTDRDCYRVTFSDGTSMVASAGHLWQTRVSGSDAKPKVRTTEEMFADPRRARGIHFMIPPSKPWQLPEAELDIDPYILGAWLGDGDKTNATITVSDEDLPFLVEQIEACGYTANPLSPKDRAELVYVSLPGSHRNRYSPVRGLLVRLREAGLLRNKHIPAEYMNASAEQREALIQGLMDTDGSIDKRGYCCFANSDPKIIDQMMQLLWSMGETPGRTWSDDPRSRYGGYWRITFTPRNITPFRMPRKLARMKAKPLTRWISIKSIELVDPVAVKCVGVDRKDHLFLAGESGKVTHNTHLYNTPQLRQTYKTLTRNLAKRRKSAQTFAVETTTMFQPGEESVAESTYNVIADVKAGKLKKRPKQLFDHRYGDITPEELGDEVKLRKALEDSYGDCKAWNDIDGLIDEIMDPRNDVTASLRYWLNTPSTAENAWLANYEWAACGPQDDDPATHKRVQPGDVITLGFDGSRKRRKGITDATALIGCRVHDGLLFEVKVWEQPPGFHGPDGWEVPVEDVNREVQKAMRTYNVVGFYADPALWESHVAAWEAKYGARLKVKSTVQHPIEWWMVGSRNFKVVEALRQFQDAVLDKELCHDGSPTLWSHIINARRRITTSGVQIAKENPDSPHKIDAAVAAVLAWQARLDAVAKGIGARQKKRIAHRIR